MILECILLEVIPNQNENLTMFLHREMSSISVTGACSVTKLCPAVCDLMDCSPPGFSVHGISQARKLDWVAISLSRESSPPRDGTRTSYIAGRFFNTEPTAAKSLQSCPTLCNPIDGNPPGSPVPGILQARTLEWVAISFSEPLGKPILLT